MWHLFIFDSEFFKFHLNYLQCLSECNWNVLNLSCELGNDATWFSIGLCQQGHNSDGLLMLPVQYLMPTDEMRWESNERNFRCNFITSIAEACTGHASMNFSYWIIGVKNHKRFTETLFFKYDQNIVPIYALMQILNFNLALLISYLFF